MGELIRGNFNFNKHIQTLDTFNYCYFLKKFTEDDGDTNIKPSKEDQIRDVENEEMMTPEEKKRHPPPGKFLLMLWFPTQTSLTRLTFEL